MKQNTFNGISLLELNKASYKSTLYLGILFFTWCRSVMHYQSPFICFDVYEKCYQFVTAQQCGTFPESFLKSYYTIFFPSVKTTTKPMNFSLAKIDEFPNLLITNLYFLIYSNLLIHGILIPIFK